RLLRRATSNEARSRVVVRLRSLDVADCAVREIRQHAREICSGRHVVGVERHDNVVAGEADGIQPGVVIAVLCATCEGPAAGLILRNALATEVQGAKPTAELSHL